MEGELVVRYTVTVSLPRDMEAAGTGAQLRQRFRNAVGGGMRRDLEDIAQRAESVTHYPPAREGYYVTQLTDVGAGTFSMGIGNKAPAWGYTQGFRGKWPPYDKESGLYAWAKERDLPPYGVARRLASWGGLDAGSFRRTWQEAQPLLLTKAAQRTYDFAVRWGNVA
jgi:hypothetical protein